MTRSLTKAWDTCQYRREKQLAYNKKYGITPRSVIRPVQESLRVKKEEDDELAVAEEVSSKDAKKLAKQLEKEMIEAVRKLEFEKAALLRDQIAFLRGEGGESLKSKSVGAYNKKKYGKSRKYKTRK